MSEQVRQTTKGSCIISEEVIATIAYNAASEVEGVASMAQRPLDLRRVVASEALKSVSVVSNPNETVIDVYFNILVTANIPTVSEQVQLAVKNAVQSMTGSPVTKVNIHVVRAVAEPMTTEQQAEE